jgi:ABC-type multidrug transport system fused ATPase/permease subunit
MRHRWKNGQRVAPLLLHVSCGVASRCNRKSSIIVALFRLSELSSGSIVIDGRNIGELGLQLLRQSVSIVPQDPVLFATSVRSNLDPFGTHSDESVRCCLRCAAFVCAAHSCLMADDGATSRLRR